jgi:hypothetical protein
VSPCQKIFNIFLITKKALRSAFDGKIVVAESASTLILYRLFPQKYLGTNAQTK